MAWVAVAGSEPVTPLHCRKVAPYGESPTNQTDSAQISSTERGVRRIIMDAATNRAAPTTVKTKCHQLQLNSLFTATVEVVADEHAS
jgi:hypothetical protein